MAVVAVLEIHMDKNAVASMNPSISLGGLVPMTINTLKIGFLEQRLFLILQCSAGRIDLIKKTSTAWKVQIAKNKKSPHIRSQY